MATCPFVDSSSANCLFYRALQVLLVQKYERTQRLGLGGSGHPFFDRQMIQERIYLFGSHCQGVAFIMEQNKAANPLNIGFLSTETEVPGPDCNANLVAEFGFGG